MTWYVKARKPDGSINSILCDSVKGVAENVTDQRGRGYKVWIEDTSGKTVDEKQFFPTKENG